MVRSVWVLVFASCGGGYSKLKVDQVQSVAVALADTQPACAYHAIPLRAGVTYKNGDRVASQLPGEPQRGRLRTSEFQWSASHGTIDELAVLRLPHDPLRWFDAPIEVRARVAAKPELAAVASFTPRFDCGGTVDLRGAPGARGGELEDGGSGAPGPAVDVSLAYLNSSRSGRLVLVRVRRDDQPPEYFVVAPESRPGPFVLDARGGDGGRGGQGMPGAHGYAGQPGAPGFGGPTCEETTPGGPGTEGSPGGPGGPGRHGGDGGAGGQVMLRYDARFVELRGVVVVRVEGGAAGEAGAGGPGGEGGNGGAGGQGGKLPVGCPGSYAASGDKGPDGADGPDGPPGSAGVAGPMGRIAESAEDVAALFADEIARGIPIVTGGAP